MYSKHTFKLFFCSFLLALASCASVGTANEASSVEAQPKTMASNQEVAETEIAEADKSDRVICKRTRVTGSKFIKKVCGTASEWEAKEQHSQEAAEDFQKKGRGWEPTR